MDKCIYCNGTDLIRGISIGLTAEHGHVGLKHNAFIGIVGTEPLYADLCNSCGSITRFHVGTTDQKWLIKKLKS